MPFCQNCGSQIDEGANFCVNCGQIIIKRETSDNAYAQFQTQPVAQPQPTFQPTRKRSPLGIIFVGILIALLIFSVAVSVFFKKGQAAFEAGDFENAYDYFEKTKSYVPDAEVMQKDCEFFITLEDLTNEWMDTDSEDLDELKDMASRQLSKLKKYKYEDYYYSGLAEEINTYLEGLEKIKDADGFESVTMTQWECLYGAYEIEYVLYNLYNSCRFMSDNKQFVAEFIDTFPEDERFIKAFQELEESGFIETEKCKCKTTKVECYYQNITDYSADEKFVFDFYKYNSDEYVTTVYVEVHVEPHSEYTVVCDVPKNLQSSGYTVQYSHFNEDIKTEPD